MCKVILRLIPFSRDILKKTNAILARLNPKWHFAPSTYKSLFGKYWMPLFTFFPMNTKHTHRTVSVNQATEFRRLLNKWKKGYLACLKCRQFSISKTFSNREKRNWSCFFQTTTEERCNHQNGITKNDKTPFTLVMT